MTRYRFECPAFHIAADTDARGMIVRADAEAAVYVGEHIDRLLAWAWAYAGHRIEMESLEAGGVKFYKFDCPAFQITVDCDDAGIIRRIDAPAQKFTGQHLEAFVRWIRKYGGVETRIDQAPGLFE